MELEAAVELAEVELVSRSTPETQVAIAARAESETPSSGMGMTKVKTGNIRKEVREAIPEEGRNKVTKANRSTYNQGSDVYIGNIYILVLGSCSIMVVCFVITNI